MLAALCLKYFIIQGKSFGRTNGPGTYADDTDRGIVYDARDLSSTDVVAFNIFVLLYVVFNFTVAILIIPAAPIALRTFLKQIQRREYIKPYIKSLFWSAVFTGALYIAVYIVIKIVIFTRRDIIKILANGAKVLDLIDDFTIISVVVPSVPLRCTHHHSNICIQGHPFRSYCA